MNEGTYEDYIAVSRYARYLPDLKRRERWDETVTRFIDFFEGRFGNNPDYTRTFKILKEAITDKKVLPSMRAVMTAGRALERDHVAGYNCAYIAADNIRVFDESLYIMLCGTGLGFSVERQHIAKLPEVAESFHDTETTIVVSDSKLGWAKALKELVSLLYQGEIPKIDTSSVRKAGEILKTFGEERLDRNRLRGCAVTSSGSLREPKDVSSRPLRYTTSYVTRVRLSWWEE